MGVSRSQDVNARMLVGAKAWVVVGNEMSRRGCY